jgi:2-polyprenyl-6-methoxyphenol hydroxylase-like FAD-dependent oxidoreductase
MRENIGIVGAGICGLSAALALSRHGNEITIYERDLPPPSGNAEKAFFDWPRKGAAQFRHPHAFLGVMCNILQKKYPSLVEKLWDAGARKISFEDMVPLELRDQYQQEADDEEMWLLMCRRATMESVLRRHVEEIDNVNILSRHDIVGPTAVLDKKGVRLNGLEIRANRGPVEVREHDIIVDASGRNSKFPRWFSDLGASISVEEEDAEIVYYTRHYKLNAGEDEPSRTGKDRSAGDLGYIKYGVFPGDNGHFAIILCLPNHETDLREAVKNPALFDKICRSIPGLYPWLEIGKSSPTTSSFGFGNIKAVWRHFVNKSSPVALNYFAIGDAAVRTNPLYGRGCSTGIVHAHLLEEVLHKFSNPKERALAFDRVTEEELRPIYQASLQEDRLGKKRANAILQGKKIDGQRGIKQWLRASFGDALASASRENMHVFRGVMKSFNLMEKPGYFLKDNRIKRTILRYMLRGRKKNSSARYQRGPSRLEMISIIKDEENKAA